MELIYQANAVTIICKYKGKEVTSYYNGEKFELVSNLYNVMCPYCSCITFYNIKIIIIYFIKFNNYNINYSKKNYFL